MLWLSAIVVACHEPRRVDTDTATHAAPSGRSSAGIPDSNRADTARALKADSIVPRQGAAPAAVSLDSSPAKPSYPRAPGWLVVAGLLAPEDSVITIFPFDSAWRYVDRRGKFTLLFRDGATAVLSNVRMLGHDEWVGIDLAVRAAAPVRAEGFFAGWLLPMDSAVGAIALPIQDSLSADGNLRTWSAGPVRLVLRRTSRTSAQLTGEQPGLKPAHLQLVAIDTATDNHMGTESPATLSLSEGWRLPNVGAAFRLGTAGPFVVVFLESGYECQNYRVVIFSKSATEIIEEPHYYYCQVGR